MQNDHNESTVMCCLLMQLADGSEDIYPGFELSLAALMLCVGD